MKSTYQDINYTFNSDEIQALTTYGIVISHEADEVLADEETNRPDFMITLSGEIHIFAETPKGQTRIGWMEPGQFTGDISVITGSTSLARIIMGHAGDVLHISHDRLRELLVENSHLSDIIVRTLTARHAYAFDVNHASVIVVGDEQDRDVVGARGLLSRRGVPHLWLSPKTDPLAERLLNTHGLNASDLPVLFRGGNEVLVQPDTSKIADAFGFDKLPQESRTDVLVVGAGPAGLAVSVYAASEGLDVIAIDASDPGGQAGTSSKIENYLGFPTGLSGQELTDRAVVQAQKFGVTMASPVQAASLERQDDWFRVDLADGRKIKSRAVVVATGAQYRRLPLSNIDRFEGRGVFYGATPIEAKRCEGDEVAIVGAGNSAGQAAVFLSEIATKVRVLFRRSDIRETMSEYLVRRLEAIENVIFHPETEISGNCPGCRWRFSAASNRLGGAHSGFLIEDFMSRSGHVWRTHPYQRTC